MAGWVCLEAGRPPDYGVSWLYWGFSKARLCRFSLPAAPAVRQNRAPNGHDIISKWHVCMESPLMLVYGAGWKRVNERGGGEAQMHLQSGQGFKETSGVPSAHPEMASHDTDVKKGKPWLAPYGFLETKKAFFQNRPKSRGEWWEGRDTGVEDTKKMLREFV